VDYVEEIKAIEKDTEEKKTEKIRLEEQEKGLIAKRAELVEELQKIGIKEEDLEDWLAKEKIKIEEGIGKCKQILSGN